MSILLILGLIVLLYIRTLNFNYIIDDNVKRSGYMYEVPLTLPDPNFQLTRPSEWYRLFMIGMHCVNTWIIYMLWGWCPALLFGVHPMSVWGVAWVTGNYYATTAYFCLIAYYILHAFPNILGALVAMPIFAAGLNSTICCVSFPFIFLLTGQWWGCSLFIPLAIYLRGRKFSTGIKIRDSFKENKPLVIPKFELRRFYLIPKIMALYILDCFFPDKCALFAPYGHEINDDKNIYDRWHSCNFSFWKSLSICGVTFIGGMFVSPLATIWFFTILALHSQWRMTGQFYAQRYLYCALPGFCVVVGILIQSHPILVAIIATFLFIRSFLFIPAFKNNEALLLNDLDAFPNYSTSYNSLAQNYLNYPYPKDKPMPGWRVNQIGYLLFKAEEMEPKSWSIKMNVACFFAMIGQWPVCMQKTTESLNLVKPLGGLPQPVEILEQQIKNINQIFEKEKAGVSTTLMEILDQQTKSIIELIDNQKDPSLDPVREGYKNMLPLLDGKKVERSNNMINSIGKQLNTLIELTDSKSIAIDSDFTTISNNLNLLIEKKKKELDAKNKQGVAVLSPQNAVTGGKQEENGTIKG